VHTLELVVAPALFGECLCRWHCAYSGACCGAGTVWRVSVSVALCIEWSLLWHRYSLESVCVGGTVHTMELVVAPIQFRVSVSVGTKCFLSFFF